MMTARSLSPSAAILFAIVLFGLPSLVVAVDANRNLTTEPSLDEKTYAAEYGVTTEEGARRITLQGTVGDIGATIEEAEPATYAGRWIQHEPNYSVIFAFTSGANAMFSKYLVGTALESAAEVREVTYSLSTLEATADQLRSLGVDKAHVAIIESTNAIHVYTDDRAGFEATAANADVALDAVIFEPGIEVRSASFANMYGGPFLRSCTAGFSILKVSTGSQGILTAGHCPDNQVWGPTGAQLNFRTVNVLFNHDEQWHVVAPPNTAAYPNWVLETGTTHRSITSKRAYANQNEQDYGCKFAFSTGYTCGVILSKSGAVCNNNTGGDKGIWMHNVRHDDLLNSGESGGPWFINGVALGISSCEVNHLGEWVDATYVAESFVETGLGVTIKTAP